MLFCVAHLISQRQRYESKFLTAKQTLDSTRLDSIYIVMDLDFRSVLHLITINIVHKSCKVARVSDSSISGINFLKIAYCLI